MPLYFAAVGSIASIFASASVFDQWRMLPNAMEQQNKK
jgi:hypothetical protein